MFCQVVNDNGTSPASGISWKETLFIVMVVCLFCLPFIDKAFHIDDVYFIKLSKSIGWNPLHAIPTDFNLSGKLNRGYLAYEDSHPLLIPYYIKIVTALFGENEVSLHLAFLVFPVVAALSLVMLDSALFPKSGAGRRLMVLLFIAFPSFIVNTQTIMTDVPTLAFLLLAIACYCHAFAGGPAILCWAGSLSICLAVFSQYQMLVFVPLLFVYARLKGKLTTNVTLSLAFPILLLGIWTLAVYNLYGLVPFFKSKAQHSTSYFLLKGFRARVMADKVLSVLAFIGSWTIFLLPAYHALNKTLLKFFGILGVGTIVCFLPLNLYTGYAPARNLLLALLVTLGLITLKTVIALSLRSPLFAADKSRGRFLALWTVLVAGYAMFILPMGSARYLLPAVPPILLVLMNAAEWRFSLKRDGLVVSLLASLSIFAGYASAYSDYRYAAVYRDFAQYTLELRTTFDNSAQVWYVGEWGMRYYMDKAGARYLFADSREPRQGDFIVIPEMPRFWQPATAITDRMVLMFKKPYASGFPLRLFNRRSTAGFYGHYWGLLPFALSSEPDEVFGVFRVIR